MIQSKIVEETQNIELYNKQYRTIDDIVVDVIFKLYRDDNYGADIDGNRGVVKYDFEIVEVDNIHRNGILLKTVSPNLKSRIIEVLEPKADWFD